MSRVKWAYNAFVAIVIATVVAAGFLIVVGHAAGVATWLFWVLCSFVTSGIIDLTTRSPKP